MEDNCNCPMECNSITYSFTTVSTPFIKEEMCLLETKEGHYMMKQFYEHKFPPQFIRKLIEVKDNISSNATEYCKRSLEYRAEVIFRMATDSVTVTVMSSRLTFFDKMSSFGKLTKC